MRFSKAAILATIALIIFALFGVQSLVERFLVADARSYFIAIIIWLLCLMLVRNHPHQL